MQTMSPKFASTAAAVPWYRHRWPWLLMAGPAVVVVAGVFTAWLAISRADALVADATTSRARPSTRTCAAITRPSA